MKILSLLLLIALIAGCSEEKGKVATLTKTVSKQQHATTVTRGATPQKSVEVELLKDVQIPMSDTDSLNDVFPDISVVLQESRVAPSLVDGSPDKTTSLPRKGNSIVVPHDKGPVYITWDFGKEAITGGIQLDELTLVIVGLESSTMDSYMRHVPNFDGELQLSNDGVNFSTIAGTKTQLIAPHSKELNVVRWKFADNVVKNFRFLRIKSNGVNRLPVRFGEVDGTISKFAIKKSSSIDTTYKFLDSKEVKVKSIPSQVGSKPMEVVKSQFKQLTLVRNSDNQVILDLKPFFNTPSSDWKIVSRKTASDNIKFIYRRNDNLNQIRTMTIDANDRIKCTIEVNLPEGNQPVTYNGVTASFKEKDLAFDGCTFGGVPAFVKRSSPSLNPFGGLWIPYLIFPAKAADCEIQFYIPKGYDYPGVMSSFSDGNLCSFEIYGAVNNSDSKNAEQISKWNPIPKVLVPGSNLLYAINIGVFKITPMTLGQKDIENCSANALVGVDTGIPGQQAPGLPTVLQRDKMQFVGFNFREPVTEKIGHSGVDVSGVFTYPGMLERVKKAGFGVFVLMADEYVDVSHGTSLQGKYDEIPEYVPQVIKNLQKNDIRVVYWFSPRGFLNQVFLGRPRDLLLDKHPEWFDFGAHWGGLYQTLNPYNKEGNQWVMDKMTFDMKKYGIEGFALDTFPTSSLVANKEGKTVLSKELDNVANFRENIKNNNDNGLLMANAAVSVYDEFMNFDYTVTEHFPVMFMNEVLGGRAFGKPFIAHIQWQQIYGWYITLAQMYYNFCDYDQTLGWTHLTWLGWLDPEREKSIKNIDEEVVPLWYIMGKSKRIYGAEVAPNIRQIESVLPDGTRFVILASMRGAPADVEIIPQTIDNGTYTLAVTTDNYAKRLTQKTETISFKKGDGFAFKDLSPYSITVMKFSNDKNK